VTLDRGNPQPTGPGTNLGQGTNFGPGANLGPGVSLAPGAGNDTPAITAPLPAAAVAALLSQAFLWMFAGLLLTAIVAFAVQGNETLRRLAADYFIVLVLGQLGMVIAISAGIRRFGATAALGLFFVYAATLGLTVGLIVSLYTGESVATAFLSAGAMFGGAALFGATT
jgi:FtsH-binding integral membrane protein